MASIFGHAAVAYAFGQSVHSIIRSRRFWVLTFLCSWLPDADVLGFAFGIPYEHMLGHRGLTHSIAFALLVGIAASMFLQPELSSRSPLSWGLVVYFSLVTLSHGVLDAATDGGLGVAFFAPFHDTRYFFPWRPIAVSPIGLTAFFSSWGIGVLLSELVWIGIPVLLWLLGQQILKKWKY